MFNSIHELGVTIRLSRESDKLSEIQRQEQNKTDKYTAIGTTLQKISGPLEILVEPQLGQSSLVQDDCKKKIEQNDSMIRKHWTDAVNAFVEDVTRAVDSHVRVALLSIKNEAGHTKSGTSVGNKRRNLDHDNPFSGGQHKDRRSFENRADSSFGDFGDIEEGHLRAGKRRKTRALSLRPHGSPDKYGDSEQIDMMKRKIEKQAQVLADFARENAEVRWTVCWKQELEN